MLLKLQSAILRDPLIVSPDVTVREAITQMSGLRSRCPLIHSAANPAGLLLSSTFLLETLHLAMRSSCVLVVENDRLVGIVTERDVVRLSAQQQPLEDLTLRQVMTHPVKTLPESELTDLFFAIALLQQHHIRHLPLVDQHDRLVGLVTHESLQQIVRSMDLLRLRSVAEVMTSQVICAPQDASMLTIAQKMAHHRVSCVVIVDTQTCIDDLQIPIGILTERDLVQFQALGLSLGDHTAAVMMSTPIFTASPEESLWNVQQIMEQRLIRRVVVTGDRGDLLGIITQTSVLQALNPLELYKLAGGLEAKVAQLEAERIALLESRTAELEKQVEARTVQLRLQAERERLIAQIASRIRNSLDVQAVLDVCVAEVRSFLGCDRVLVHQFQPDWSGVILAESVLPGWRSALGNRIQDSCLQAKASTLYSSEEPIVVNDIYAAGYTPCHIRLLEQYQVKANLVVPILVQGQLWGLLIGQQCAESRDWQPEDVTLLQDLAVQLAIALQQAITHQRLQIELQERQKAEAQLKESEQRYATLAAVAPVGIFRVDIQGNSIYLNSFGRKLVGLPQKDATGGNWFTLLHPDDRDRVQAGIQRSQQMQCPFQLEYRFLKPDGTVVWVYGQAVAEQDASGQLIGYVGTITNITDRKQAELEREQANQALAQLNRQLEQKVRARTAALQASEAKLQAILDFAPAVIYVKDFDGRHTLVNQAYLRLFDYQPEAILHKTSAEIFPPEVAEVIDANDRAVIAQGIVQQYEEEIIIGDEVRTFISNKFLLRDEKGQPYALCGISTDITDRKKAEQALQDSERRYATLAQVAPVAIFRFDQPLNCTYVSDRWSEMTGRPQEFALGRGWIETLHPDDRETLLAQWKEAYSQPALMIQVFNQCEGRHLRPDGSVNWFYLQVAQELDSNGQLVGYIGTLTDITQRKQAEQENQRLKDRMEFLLAQSPAVIFTCKAGGDYAATSSSENLQRVIGYTPKEFLADPGFWADHLHPEDAPRIFAELPKIFETGDHSHEYRFLCKDGSYRWVRNELRLIYDAQGKPLEIIGYLVGIQDLKQAQAEMQALSDRLTLALQSGSIGTWDWDLMHEATWDDWMYRLYGLEDLGRPAVYQDWCDRVHPEDLSAVEALLTASARGKAIFDTEFRIWRTDGELRWIRATAVLQRDAQGNPIRMTGTNQDITSLRNAEQENRQLQDRLEFLLASSPAMIYSCKTEGDYGATFMSQNVRAILGYQPEEFTTDSSFWASRIHPEDSPRVFAELGNLFIHGIHRHEYRFLHQMGHYIWLRDEMILVRNAQGYPIEIIGYFADISDLKQAELALQESQRFIQQIAEASPNILYLYDLEEQRNVYVNREITTLLGYTPAEIQALGSAFIETLIHPEDLPRVPAQLERMRSAQDGEILEFEYRMQHRNGEWHWMYSRDAVFSRDSQGRVTQTIGAAQDVTDRKRYEAQLHQTNEELARATRLKDEFLANMSHELRTPLNAILGLTEGLQDEIFGELNPAQIKALQTIDRSGTHLLELINDILDVAKIESGQIELEYAPTSVPLICQSSLTFIRQQAQKKRIQLEVKLPQDLPDIVVDERRIRQVLINVLSNAVKFTPDNGRITLEATLLAPSDVTDHAFLRIAIADTGIGIAPEHLDRLFQPFVQIDSALNRQYTGTGLGLALVKRMVELHGGQVSVTSQEGVGSCFTIELPYLTPGIPESTAPERETEMLAPSLQPSDRSENGPLILLAEDNSDNIMTLSSYLRVRGYRILLAHNGYEAIDLARSSQPDVILMDIQMPGMDGLEAMRQIRQYPELREIPMIALTALAMPDDRDRCLAAGANDYLSKPIRLKQLATLIQHCLSQQELGV